MQLSGGILYTLCLGAHGRHLLDLDQIRVLRQSLCLLRSGQLDVQDTILELCWTLERSEKLILQKKQLRE